MIDGQNFCDQLVKNNILTFDSIRKIPTGQGDVHDCLLDYNSFKDYYKMISIYLSKQEALDADPKATQQINFTGNLNRREGAIMCFIIRKATVSVFDISRGTVRVL